MIELKKQDARLKCDRCGTWMLFKPTLKTPRIRSATFTKRCTKCEDVDDTLPPLSYDMPSTYESIEMIRSMAYFKWVNAGRPDGKDMDFWLDSERWFCQIYQRYI